jgi:hypothetical protein
LVISGKSLGFTVYGCNIAIPMDYLEDLGREELMGRVEDLIRG